MSSRPHRKAAVHPIARGGVRGGAPGRARGVDEQARHVLDCIRRIVQVIRVASRRSERAVGLSAAQLFVLQKLADHNAISLNELARRTLTHQSSASVVVSKLVESGLVERVRSTRDRRRQELSLTPEGRSVARRAPEPAQEHLIDALRSMRPADLERLAALLTGLVENLGISGTPAAAPMFDEDGDDKAGERTRDDDQSSASMQRIRSSGTPPGSPPRAKR